MNKPIIPQNKTARHTFNLDAWSRLYCFSCPLDDCAGRSSIKCPIVQAKKSQQTPPSAAPVLLYPMPGRAA